MSFSLSLDELLVYNELERVKWDEWFRTEPPEIFQIVVQSSGAFHTIWDLVDHIFVTERRHLQRLRSEYPLPETTGTAVGDWMALWEYGLASRAQLVTLARAWPADEVDVPITVPIMGQNQQVTPRKILFHIFIHELRHWAQVSTALRNAGRTPPDRQDLIFSTALA